VFAFSCCRHCGIAAAIQATRDERRYEKRGIEPRPAARGAAKVCGGFICWDCSPAYSALLRHAGVYLLRRNCSISSSVWNGTYGGGLLGGVVLVAAPALQ